MAAYLSKAVVVDPEPGVNSRVATKIHRQAVDPFFQAAGPVEPPKDQLGGDPHFQSEAADLWRRWTEATRIEAESPDIWSLHLRQATCYTYLTLGEIRRAFQDWVLQVDWEAFDRPIYFLAALESFLKQCSFSWLTGMGGAPLVTAERAHEFFAKHSVSCEPFRFERYRTPVYRPVVFAHLFSGRRESDLQSCLETLGHLAVSIDIIFHPTKGDLCRPETFELFVRAMHDGFLSGFLGGPPCETWSRARGVALEDGTTGPRIVRSLRYPFGKPELTASEDRQTSFGSRLLGVTLRLLVVALITGATGLMEHPAVANRFCEDAASFSTMLQIQGLPRTFCCTGCQAHRFARCERHRVL